MKKVLLILVLISTVFLVGCTNEKNVAIPEETQKTQPAADVPTAQPVVQEPAKTITVVQDLKRPALEIITGSKGAKYNGNPEGMDANTLKDFSSVGLNQLVSDKFYLTRSWNIRDDNVELISSTASVFIKTDAKSVSFDMEGTYYTNIIIYNGENPLPENNNGLDISTIDNGMPGMRVKGRGVYNIVKKNDNSEGSYDLRIQTNGLKIYRIILEY